MCALWAMRGGFTIVKFSAGLEGAGTAQAAVALDFAQDFGSRKNEPKGLRFGREIVGWIVVIAFVLCELDEQAASVSARSMAALRPACNALSSAMFFRRSGGCAVRRP